MKEITQVTVQGAVEMALNSSSTHLRNILIIYSVDSVPSIDFTRDMK